MKVAGLGAVVTGGASGLGLATATMLVEQGAHVAIFDVNEEAGRAHAAMLGGSFHKVDVRDEVTVAAALGSAAAAHGLARILVNCAGVAPAVRTLRGEGSHQIDVYRHTIEVNLTGTFIVLSKFAQLLRNADPIDGECGVIINTASVAAFDGQIGHAAYAASKAGVVGMTLPIARDLARYLIRVMTIAPGIFATPLLADVPGQDRVTLCSQVPHPARMGKPEEFAQLVEAIIRNPMLNGEVIRIDGALRLAPF